MGHVTSSSDFQFDDFTKKAICKKARQLVGRAGFREHDREDLEQELMLRVWQAARSFDPRTAHWNVFVTTVIERAAAKILRDRTSKKRSGTHTFSFEELIRKEEHSEQYVQDQEREWRRQQEQADLAFDLNEALRRLPDELREVADLLKKSHSIAQVARELGVSTDTIKRRIRQLRERLADYGFGSDETF